MAALRWLHWSCTASTATHTVLKNGMPRLLAHTNATAQKHFLCTIVGPDSSYSLLEIHICWKVLKEERIEPPIHTEYFRSGGATTLIFIVEGANAVSSFVIPSPMPANMVVPPESTTSEYRSFRMSTSHFMIDWNVVS